MKAMKTAALLLLLLLTAVAAAAQQSNAKATQIAVQQVAQLAEAGVQKPQ